MKRAFVRKPQSGTVLSLLAVSCGPTWTMPSPVPMSCNKKSLQDARIIAAELVRTSENFRAGIKRIPLRLVVNGSGHGPQLDILMDWPKAIPPHNTAAIIGQNSLRIRLLRPACEEFMKTLEIILRLPCGSSSHRRNLALRGTIRMFRTRNRTVNPGLK